jgi:uncharacterized protein YjbJ (UPF0337 family)
MTDTGKAMEEHGRAREDRGKRLGDDELEAEGREEKIAGVARQAGEKVRETIEGFREGLRGEGGDER